MRSSERSNCLPIFRLCAGVPVSAASLRSAITNRYLASAWALRMLLYAARALRLSLSGSPCTCATSYGLSLCIGPVTAPAGHGPIVRKVMTLARSRDVFGLRRARRAGGLRNKDYRKIAGFSENETWDAGDMACGDLVLELRLRLRAIKPHQVLRIKATDPGAREDIPAWCRLTGHALRSMKHPQYWIERKED